jgi:prepilin-type N-terminal cleavage/methylation domain-containing protein
VLRRPRPAHAPIAGFTLIELMFVVSMVAILAAAAIPQLTAGVERSRAIGTARYLARRLALARSQAVARSANVALLLVADAGTFSITSYVDGNGNGVRTREIDDGVDQQVGTAVRVADLFPHVQLFLDDPASTSTPSTTALMSFSPIGTATSRTLYVRAEDGSLYGVRVLGATGRTRVLRYVAASRTWIEIL